MGRSGQDSPDEQTPGPDGPGGASLFAETARAGKDRATRGTGPKVGKLTPAQLRELEAKKEQDAARSYHRVKEVWARMLAGDEEADREWMREAESLVETFRETRALFLSSRVSVYVTVLNATLIASLAHWIPWDVSSNETSAECGGK